MYIATCRPHTCSELYLELLEWSVSHVQNNNVTWTAPKLTGRGKNSWSVLRLSSNVGPKLDTPVLGLAGCHFPEKQRWNGRWCAGTWLQRPRVISVMNAALFVGNQNLTEKKLFICSDVSHTRPAAAGLSTKARTMGWEWGWRTMKIRWRWKWDRWTLLNGDARRGTQKKRGEKKEKTPTPTHT